MVIKLFKNFWFWAFIFWNFFDHNVCVQVWVCVYSWIHMTMRMSLFWYWWCQCLYSGIDSANVCILVMMVSMSVFWYWSLLASSITALGHFLLRQLGALCRLKCDSSICIPTRSAPSQFLLCTYSSISFPTLHCSSHSSTHCIVYPALPGCDSSIEILHCLHMIRQVQWCHYGFNVSGVPHSDRHTIQIAIRVCIKTISIRPIQSIL